MANTKKSPVKDDQTKTEQPELVTLESNYSFYDDEGLHRYWPEGQIVTDAADIAVLIERGAPLKE